MVTTAAAPRSVVSARHEVTVWLKEPLWGQDLATGESFQSTRHRTLAESVLQDPVSTLVLDGDGVVLLEFPTRAIDRVVWTQAVGVAEPQAVVKAAAGADEVGSKAWREKITKKRPRAYEKWTPEEDARLLEGRGQGLTVKALADRHQRRQGAITARLERLARK
jgi:hypothetical protein